jgi:signal transduction histidine kinase/CheY-like chemotaxis protein
MIAATACFRLGNLVNRDQLEGTNMLNTLHKSLTIAILVVSIFISGPNVEMVGAQNTVGEKKSVVELSDEEQAWLKAHSDIRFGFSDDFEPYLIKGHDGQHKGILVDFLNELNARLGTQFGTVVDSWPKLFEKVKNKELAGILGIAKVTADAKGLLKTAITFSVYPSFFIREEAPFTFNSLNDLRGRSVAMLQSAGVMEKILEPYSGDVSISKFPTNLEVMKALFEGKVDIAFGLTLHNYLIAKYGMNGIKPAYTLLDKPFEVVMGLRPDLPELVTILNKGIASFSPQELDTLVAKWVDLPQHINRIELTSEEQAWINQNRTVRVRITDWPPYLIVKGNEPPQGIVIEYLKLIEERTGITFKNEVTDQPFAEFLESMKQRQGPDMTAVIVPTLEREQYLSFSETYISSPYVIFIRGGDKPILDISALTGKMLAVLRSSAVHKQLLRDYPEIRLMLFDSDEEALQAVATGQADAYIGNLTAASHIIHRRGFSSLQVSAPSPFKEMTLSMGSRNDWPELASIINKALATISEEEKTAIRKKYLAIKYEQGINKTEVLKWILSVGGVGLGIVFMFLFWNRRLSREIMKRKQTEEDLKRARDDAEAANQAKSIFLASMSHELRTPLNAVLGFSGMLVREQNITTDQHEKLAIINRSGEHLLAMINDILDLSKIEAGRVELNELSFDLIALIEEIGVMIRSRTVGKGLSFTVEAETVSFPHVKADVGKLRQILINLLDNAVKCTDEGGVTLRCATGAIPEEPTRCHIMIEVEDTGLGIDPVTQTKVFDPFVRGIDVPVRKGTGLGLSICKNLADFMGGTIEVESEAGKGSLFRLRLPAEIAEAAAAKTPETKPRVIGLAPGQKTWRILVADDNPQNRLLLKTVLERVGFFVLQAENGKEAVEAFKNASPDLIWMDMRMPVMDGYEAVRHIRMQSGGDKLPIIAITASAFKEQQQGILAAGCDEMVIKPFQEHKIFEVMARLLGVEYVYGEPDDAATPMDAAELTAAMLADLPVAFLQELRETTLVLNQQAILQVIERIAEHSPVTAKNMRSLVQNFQIDRIREVLEEVEKNAYKP